MTKRAERSQRTQAENEAGRELAHLVEPMLTGMTTTRDHLLAWVHAHGLAALDELFRDEAGVLAGPKGRHQPSRTYHHWGRAATELTFGGRRVQVQRPRVRGTSGGEATLPSVTRFRDRDPLTARMMQQLLAGVSTRQYEASLEARPSGRRTRGSSKSAVSRSVVRRTRQRLHEQLTRRLEGLEVVALFMDGVVVAQQTVIVVLGITRDGTKVPLGLRLGSTENAVVCTDLLQDLLARGLALDGRVLCVIDGGKGLRKALGDVLGDAAVIQRCQLHKARNLDALVPKTRQAYVRASLRRAYRASTAATARRQLMALATWLERNGHADAAASVREGLEETLTVLKLGLPPGLRRFFATTNCIENLIGTLRHVTRNIKRWRDGDMRRRWLGLGLLRAAERFRRIKRHTELGALVTALGATKIAEDAA
ncbi:MAG: IS256 family transposase [Candidatus Rokuibacteriota bacterium]